MGWQESLGDLSGHAKDEALPPGAGKRLLNRARPADESEWAGRAMSLNTD